MMGNNSLPECGRLEASIQLRSVALAYIRERRRLLILLKTNAIHREYNDVFDDALTCLRDLETVSRDIHKALSYYRPPS